MRDDHCSFVYFFDDEKFRICRLRQEKALKDTMLFGNQNYLYYLGSPNTININNIRIGYAEINKDTPHDYP